MMLNKMKMSTKEARLPGVSQEKENYRTRKKDLAREIKSF